MNRTFGELVKLMRSEIGMTQRQLAEAVGMDNSYLSRIERGTYGPPSRQVAIKIVDELGITEPLTRFRFLLSAKCAADEDASAISRREWSHATWPFRKERLVQENAEGWQNSRTPSPRPLHGGTKHGIDRGP